MEIDTGDETQKKFNYDLYIFDEDRIIKTIENILLCKDYGNDYDYKFNYKNIFVNIKKYRYNCPTWRSDNLQEMIIEYDKTKINEVDLDFLLNAFHFLLTKTGLMVRRMNMTQMNMKIGMILQKIVLTIISS